MDLSFTEEEEKFRLEIRQFLLENVPEQLRHKLLNGGELTKDEKAMGARILHKKGVPSWPKAYGGAGWSPLKQYIFEEEVRAFPAWATFGYGVSLVGPVIYTFGNDAQKKYFLPRIANAEDWWCQGFSEPDAGSDLASLKTRAVRCGDHYLVNGQKIWTTGAQYADWIFCLVRTNLDAKKKQEGISFLLIDMKTAGVSVRPIRLIDGGYDVNEVFFSDVRVPADNLVGEENKGWTYAKFLLGNERFSDAGVGLSKARIQRAKDLAARCHVGGKRLIDQQTFREKLAAVEVQLKAFEMTQLRVVSSASKQQNGGQDAASSILKLRGSEIEQATTALLMDVVGPYALPEISREQRECPSESSIGPDWASLIAPAYFYSRAVTIYAGSSEIQKNIIAKAILGL
ncbi:MULTISPECIES: acyl-CoA dehydrogenase family protein [Bradyrhizobium]|uniref:acyl-CoA dehydrogenase family protein n=1 Tax=Bradyrhizobium centrosematis TaxID=1300039 RepID=UPI0021682635|nr:acyl-CoA dehydrogenase family protein [Bradyrhizobium centrosematis]MCS3765642.1 alkylation response protein AidB-like acyl-CoA dehydrogenase [Bradyrhizobium centrosematis]MCS3778176.1 alkylation response protein AidB-like acyl-CoA dehydrogenase [Bradyrhizobium centrosematis]